MLWPHPPSGTLKDRMRGTTSSTEEHKKLELIYLCAITHRVCLPHGGQKKMQHTLLSHGDVGSVGKVNESSHHLGADVSQRDL